MKTKEEKLEYARNYKLTHKEQIKKASCEYHQRQRLKWGREKTAKENQYWARLRKERILTHYGGNRLACVKCGFDDIQALSIDHINAIGAKGRPMTGGTNFYAWLVKNNYPKGYQTLCMNCQWIKRFENKEHNRKLM